MVGFFWGVFTIYKTVDDLVQNDSVWRGG